MKNNKNNLGWLLVATIVITLMVVLLSIQTISGISFADIARAPIGPIGVTNLIKTYEEFKKKELVCSKVANDSVVALKENDDFINSNQGSVASKTNVKTRITKAIELLKFE